MCGVGVQMGSPCVSQMAYCSNGKSVCFSDGVLFKSSNKRLVKVFKEVWGVGILNTQVLSVPKHLSLTLE